MEIQHWTTRELGADTWDAFAELVERNGGIYGGCWCIPRHVEYQRGLSDPRTLKEQLVRSGRAKAALVFDDEGRVQGWCQYGAADELVLTHERAYRADPPPRARWRVACIYVDRRHRGQGVARTALRSALVAMAAARGGRVEAIAETTKDRVAQGRFLFSGTAELYEEMGFARVRPVGLHAWILSREIAPTP